MTDFTEKVKQNALLTFSIVLLASLALTFLILIYTGIFGNRDSAITKKEKAELASNDELLVKQITGQNSEDKNANAVSYMPIKLPMLVGPFYEEKIEGKKRGCDTIYMITRWVPQTTMPLNAVYRELFKFKTDLDFFYGNYVMYHPQLAFDRATIDKGFASVYLTGKMEKVKNNCDRDRLRIQIEETAFQFDTVKSVQIYLNGKLYK